MVRRRIKRKRKKNTGRTRNLTASEREKRATLKTGQDKRPDRYHNYTPLTVSRAKIFEMHKKDGKWQ